MASVIVAVDFFAHVFIESIAFLGFQPFLFGSFGGPGWTADLFLHQRRSQ